MRVSSAPGDQRWILTDTYGRRWYVTFHHRPVAPPLRLPVSRVSGPGATLDALVESAFSPWGTADRETIEDLLEICWTIVGNDPCSSYLSSGNQGRYEHLERIRDILLDALRHGWISCSPAVASAYGLWERPQADDDGPATLRDNVRGPFTVRLLDEVGEPISGVEVEFGIRGDLQVVRTDSNGIARIEEDQDASAVLRIVDVDALRDIVRPRWRIERSATLPTEGEVVVREIANDLGHLSLRSWHEVTFVIQPHRRCLNVLGAHFAFGRSFPTAAAFDKLAHISDVLRGPEGRMGMIFGHTDLSGPEIVNKELSERRAKAVYAILSHDDEAWVELFTGSKDLRGPGHWQERWGSFEVRHMLTALGILGEDGSPLESTASPFNRDDRAALARFQSGDYRRRPAEQRVLPETGELDEATSRELFLAYAKLVERRPVSSSRLASIDGAPFMGCGEFNPLSMTAKDAESRRVTVLLFDPASRPEALPCRLRNVKPCHANLESADSGAPSPYRCRVYQGLSRCCPAIGGNALDHDFLVRIPFSLSRANEMPHIFVLESDDGTLRLIRALGTDARALGDDSCEVHFSDVPDSHAYRLSYEVEGECNVLVDFAPYDAFPERSFPLDIDVDRDAMSSMFARMAEADAAFARALTRIEAPAVAEGSDAELQ